MEKDRSHITERILNITLEIIYLLTGEDYIVVKKSREHVTSSSCPRVSGGLSRTQSPITVPPPHSLTHERNHDQNILKLTNKIIQLLTGEEYLEGYDNLYKDVMEKDKPLNLLDTSETRNAAGRLHTTTSPPAEDQSVIKSKQRATFFTENMAERSEHEGGNVTDTDVSTQYLPTHIKKDSVSRQVENLCGYTDHTQLGYICFKIKEEANSYEGGHLTDIYIPTDHTFTSTHIKEEPFSCKGGNLTDINVESPTEQTQYSSCSTEPIGHQIYQSGDKQFICSYCTRCFSRASNLVRHEKIHTGDRPFVCAKCGKCFDTSSNLFAHHKSHTGEKAFPCSVCGKCFTKNSDLIRHQRIHTGEKPYSCVECGKCFNTSSSLNVHQRIHAGQKSYSCSECGKCFIQKSTLNNHLRTHTGEKPFSCFHCGKCFASYANFIVHQKIHTGEKPHLCSECGKCFRHKSNLNMHLKIHRRERDVVGQ